MASYAWPALFALGIWWLSTGAIMYVSGLSARSFRWSLPSISLLALGSIGMASVLGQTTTETGAYLGFVLGLTVWAWHEMTFLTGLVTGPQTGPLRASAKGFERLMRAIGAILWHELAIIATAGALAVLTWDAPNKMALWTFCLLWAMRTSAKFNLFYGVRNLSADLLPDRMRYLATYFRQAPCNWFFPLSIVASCTIAAALFATIQSSDVNPFHAASCALLGALLCLGILEHLLMVLPISTNWLWRWSLRSRTTSHKSEQHKPHDLLSAQPRLASAKYSD
ncbi:MAG: putative photosynthetic complex assembly protein PuhE [Pseudomonadota bacterium]